MKYIYNEVTNLELAKNIDDLLGVLIKYYSHEMQHGFPISGVTKKMQELGYSVTEEQVRATMNSMYWLGLLTNHTDQQIGNYPKVSNLGYYVHGDGGLYKKIEQSNEDAQRQRDNIKASIRTNNNVIFNVWLTLLVAALSCYFQYDKDSNQKLRDEVTKIKLELIQSKTQAVQKTNPCFHKQMACEKYKCATNDTNHVDTSPIQHK